VPSFGPVTGVPSAAMTTAPVTHVLLDSDVDYPGFLRAGGESARLDGRGAADDSAFSMTENAGVSYPPGVAGLVAGLAGDLPARLG
jgi:hypothetical protein